MFPQLDISNIYLLSHSPFPWISSAAIQPENSEHTNLISSKKSNHHKEVTYNPKFLQDSTQIHRSKNQIQFSQENLHKNNKGHVLHAEGRNPHRKNWS